MILPSVFILLGFNTLASTLTTSSDLDALVFDESEIYNAFSSIDELVTIVGENDISYSELALTNNNLLTSVNQDASIALYPEDDRFSFNKQTAFLMGCAFGMLGILAVAIVDKGNTRIVKSSIWGCVASGCISTGLTIVVYFSYFMMYDGYYY